MKNNLKKFIKSNITDKFNLGISIIKEIKLSNFQIIFIVYAIIFSIFLTLSLPSLFNIEKYKEEIAKNTYSDFKINLKNLENIKYRFVPTPHLKVGKAEIYLSNDEDSKVSELENLKIFISLYEFYRNRKIEIKKIVVNKGNFYFKDKNFVQMNNHLKKNIIKPIYIDNSNFFYKSKKNEIVTIAPINELKYFIDLNSKEKKLKIKGKLFDTKYDYVWKKNYKEPNIVDIAINFKKPNIRISQAHTNLPNKQSTGNLKIDFLENDLDLEYIYKDDKIEISSSSKNSLSSKFDGKIFLNPFYFDTQVILYNKNFQSLLSKLLVNIYDFGDSINNNFNGIIDIKLEDIKNSFFKSGQIKVVFRESKVNFEKNIFKIKKIGNFTLTKNEFEEVENKIYFKSKVLINIEDQNEFYRRFSISKSSRINLKKISLIIEKDIDQESFYISNIILNEGLKIEKKVDDSELDKFKFSNIQQLRKIAKDYFARIY